MNFRKAEPWFFWCLVLLHLIPVLSVNYFVTHDGPAHVYNADLIKSLLFTGDNTSASDFYEFNSFPQPNWTGHLLMILFSFVFSPAFSEILLVCSILIGNAWGFRYLIKYLVPAKLYHSWFVFPFLHGFLLYMGFYNFCLGTGLVFFAAGWWLRNREVFNLKKAGLLFLLLIGLYFSHLFCLFVFLVWMGFSMLLDVLTNKQKIKFYLKWSLPILPVVLLSIVFVATGEQSTSSSRDFLELLKWIADARPVITLHYEKQQLFSVLAGASVLVVLFYFTFIRIAKERALRASDSLALTALFCLLCYFIFPDEAATGGFVSVRFLLFFFLFSLAWIACRITKNWMGFALAGILLLVSVRMLWFHYHEMKRLSDDVVAYTEGGQFINPGEVVLPLNYSDNWLHSNISCYLGAEKHALLLDNYEASKPHFPLLWKKEMEPYSIIGKFSSSIPPCCDPQQWELQTGRVLDAILMWRYQDPTDSCSKEIKRWMMKSYNLEAPSSDQIFVYKLSLEK